ncbi:MAG: hypothetical protein ACFFDC_14720 [Promethearchaeota archaeon]
MRNCISKVIRERWSPPEKGRITFGLIDHCLNPDNPIQKMPTFPYTLKDMKTQKPVWGSDTAEERAVGAV